MIKGKPFVKWAGGKRQIIDKLKKYIPDEYGTYYEPFVGGGALLFELSPKNAVINDYNAELMNVFNCIKDEDKFNRMADYKRAARTIYLNKACFNGLYRVNSKNEFNVPFGKKTKINTYDGQNLSIITFLFEF